MDAAVSERRRPEGADRTSATVGVGSSPGVAFKYGFFILGFYQKSKLAIIFIVANTSE